MNRPAGPLVIVVGFICVAAIGLALAAAAMGRGDMILIAAVFTLGLAQLVHMATAGDASSLNPVTRAELKMLRERLAALEAERQAEARPASVAAARPAPAAEAAQVPEPQREAPMPLNAEQLDFFLEPVIDLASGRTAHYRASLMLRMAGGVRFGMDSVRRGAERAGVGSLLEALTISRALPVLHKLKDRGRGASIFVPVSGAALACPTFHGRVRETIAAQEQLVSGLVLDIEEASIAALKTDGMRGLQKLAEAGFTFCLSGSKGRGPSPGTLVTLGFRFVVLDSKLIESGEASTYTEACRMAGIEVVAAQVDDREALIGLPDKASLGFGPLFAQPRLVRNEAAENAAAA